MCEQVKVVCVVGVDGFFEIISFLAFLLILQRRGYSIPPQRSMTMKASFLQPAALVEHVWVKRVELVIVGKATSLPCL